MIRQSMFYAFIFMAQKMTTKLVVLFQVCFGIHLIHFISAFSILSSVFFISHCKLLLRQFFHLNSDWSPSSLSACKFLSNIYSLFVSFLLLFYSLFRLYVIHCECIAFSKVCWFMSTTI